MRILFVTHTVSWTGGGIFFNAYHTARQLVGRGHQVTILTIAPSGRWRFNEFETDAAVNIVETPDLLSGRARTGWDPWNAICRVVWMQKRHFDLVHAFESRPVVAVPTLWMKWQRQTPTVFTWADWFGSGGKGSERGRWLRLLMEPIETACENWVYPHADVCVAMGEPLSEHARSLGIPAPKVLTLLHGCDTEKITVGDKASARTLLGIQSDAVVLGYLGVLRPTSAQLLFDAFNKIVTELDGRSCRLLLIGNHKLNLNDYVRSESRQNVIETGWIDYQEINTNLAACDLLLLPLKSAVATENVWPSKLNDYLAAGRPVVATDMRVIRDTIGQEDVVITTADNSEAFALGCVEALRDPERLVCRGQKARSLAETKYSWKQVVDALERRYLELVTN